MGEYDLKSNLFFMIKHVFKLMMLLIAFASLSAQNNYYSKKGTVLAGYDVVGYFNNKVIKGTKAYAFEYDGGTFLFASQEHLDTFKANPESFVPQYGGYCAYAMAVKGKAVSVDPKTFEIRDGKLYLFYNSWGNNTLESWLEEQPDTLVKQADKNFEDFKKQQ